MYIHVYTMQSGRQVLLLYRYRPKQYNYFTFEEKPEKNEMPAIASRTEWKKNMP